MIRSDADEGAARRTWSGSGEGPGRNVIAHVSGSAPTDDPAAGDDPATGHDPAAGGAPTAADAPMDAPSFLVRHARSSLLVIVAGALAIRVSGVSWWWINPDEGIYFSLAIRSTWAEFWSELSANAHPPLYYVMLRAIGAVTFDFVWFRALSLASGVGAVVALWAAARELTGRVDGRGVATSRATAAGLVAAALLALSPMAVVLSQIVRPYMLQLALVGGAVALLLRWNDASGPRTVGAYVTLVVLSLLTHYSSVLALAALGLVALYRMKTTVTDRGARRGLVGAHAAAGAVFVALYFLHLRALTVSDIASDALQGWLSYYLVDSPRDAWLAVLGLQTTVLGRSLGGAAATALLVALGLAAMRRAWLPIVLAGSALAVGLGASAAGLYPMGATRHSVWMLAFTVPVVAWMAGVAVTSGRRLAVAAIIGLVLLGAARQSLGDVLGVPDSPRAASERVLRRADLMQVLDVVGPEGSPRLLLMDLQTYYLLLPFYHTDRGDADIESDDSFFHFRYGERDVVVVRSWLATLGEGAPEPGDLRTLIRRVDRAAPELGVASGERAVVLLGGWHSAVVDSLLALDGEGGVVGRRTVPGLRAFLVDPVLLAEEDERAPGA